MALAVALTDGRTVYAPGNEVAGTASWSLPDARKWLEIRLIWYTSGKGTRANEMVERVHIKQPAKSDSETFAFTLPEGPYSFSGKLISLIWAVEVVTASGDDAARAEFVVSPTGAEIRLATAREDQK